MKQWISFWVLMMVGVGAFAQKSYVNVIGRPMYASNRGTSLSGAVPKDMEKFYDNYQYEFGDGRSAYAWQLHHQKRED